MRKWEGVRSDDKYCENWIVEGIISPKPILPLGNFVASLRKIPQQGGCKVRCTQKIVTL